MKWLELSYETRLANEEAVSNVFLTAGANGVWFLEGTDKENVLIKSYLAKSNDFDDVFLTIKRDLYNIDQEYTQTISITEHEEKDLIKTWEQNVSTVEVGQKFIIKTPTERALTVDKRIEIVLDPSAAFGDGTHETTQLCLEMLGTNISHNSEVIDIGTGTGVLAIAAAKLGAKNVLATDLNEGAVSQARRNAELNNVYIIVKKRDLLNGDSVADFKPNLIVANILGSVIFDLILDVSRLLRNDGLFIASGIIIEEKDSIYKQLNEHGFEIEKELNNNGWVAFAARKKA